MRFVYFVTSLFYTVVSRRAWQSQGNVLGITESGAWYISRKYKYVFDKTLANALLVVFKGKSVLELGAGLGHYSKFLLSTGKLKALFSYDGVPDIQEVSRGLVHYADFTHSHNFSNVDWVLSTEVGEHIPTRYQQQFLSNIIQPAKVGVVLSWAVPGQLGEGHVNCLPNHNIVQAMFQNGFCLLPRTSQALRQTSSLPWFKRTIMVFSRGLSVERFLDLHFARSILRFYGKRRKELCMYVNLSHCFHWKNVQAC
uniref:Methyltransferase domain protein n=1 Tax=Tetraselmis sp. GSL018 TaxID=582737 RepID=A0A061SH67_9CHLO|mmetsp:Transcript_21127/g.50469  ORF Transcript_21127/g.50469 Transcript_21127/m.50469 type:complete len:254 (+) Transcript_21127:467-1228(+)